jgi:Holliday junction resolvase
MATPEALVKRKVTTLLKKEGVYYFYPMTHGLGRSGVPDIIACVPPHGRFLGIECKAGKNKATPLQIAEIEAIRHAGGSAVIVSNLADELEQLEKLIRILKQ